MSTEVVKTGGVYRVLAALSPVTWNKISFWTKALDVEFNDGATAESKVGAISGITTDPASNSNTYAASSKLVRGLANDITIAIAASDWSASTISVSGNNYYYCDKSVTKVYLEHPIIYLSSNTIPTDDQQTAFSYIECVANSSTNKLRFYSTDNTVALNIGVKGVL
jgi:YHS domain-containing protein